MLVDAQSFPRDKTCGDGLIPDTFEALARLGLSEAVATRMNAVAHAHCLGPRGGALRIPGQLGVLRRRELDHILCEGARDAGATVAMPWRLVALETREADARVIGARLRQGDVEQMVMADWVVLATGAALDPLLLSELCSRRSPSSMAIRGYVHHPDISIDPSQMQFIWHPKLSPGYGWIFPMGQGRYNVGVGVDGLHHVTQSGRAGKKHAVNLRALFERFCEVHPTAKLLKEQGHWEGDLKGAPMRCDLDGATWGRPGLLPVGEAVGATYAFTGEGIGKALETGMAAAHAIHAAMGVEASAGSSDQSDQQVIQLYRDALQALLPRYQMYRKATQFNRWPWMIDLVIWRAHKSTRFIKLMSDVLAERRLPGTLLSWRGVKRFLLG